MRHYTRRQSDISGSRSSASRHTLFSNVEGLGTVRIVVATAEEFAEDRIVPVSQASAGLQQGSATQTRGHLGKWQHMQLLYALGLDVPSCEVVLQHANKTLFQIVAVLRTARQGGSACGGGNRRRDAPEDEVQVGHEVCDAFEHTPRLEYEGGEGDFVEIHADPGHEVSIDRVSTLLETHLSCEMSEEIIEPSCVSLQEISSSSLVQLMNMTEAGQRQKRDEQDRCVVRLGVLRHFVLERRSSWTLHLRGSLAE